MWTKMRVVSMVLAGLLLAWLVLLLTAGTSMTYRDGAGNESSLSVRCSPPIWYVWGEQSMSGLVYGEAQTFTVTDGRVPESTETDTPVSEKVNDACDRQRTAAVALSVLLLVPIAALTWLSVRPPRRPSRDAVIRAATAANAAVAEAGRPPHSHTS